MYLVACWRARSQGNPRPEFFGTKLLNAFLVCLVILIINFIVVYFVIGHRDKTEHYVRPYLKDGKLIK